jgi:hypothetical protein
MKHALDINRETALGFVKKARQFLNLPRELFSCDIKKCNPALYKGKKGIAAIKRSRKGLAIVKRVDKSLESLCKLLEV